MERSTGSSFERPPVLRGHFGLAEGVVSQDRDNCTYPCHLLSSSLISINFFPLLRFYNGYNWNKKFSLYDNNVVHTITLILKSTWSDMVKVFDNSDTLKPSKSVLSLNDMAKYKYLEMGTDTQVPNARTELDPSSARYTLEI